MSHSGPQLPRAEGFGEAALLRRKATTDIVRRLMVIPPSMVRLVNYMGLTPKSVFNPGLAVNHRGVVDIYARISIGYYSYASAIARLRLGLDEILSGSQASREGQKPYGAELVVVPSTWYDFWGAEDPRVYTINSRLYMTYTGRTRNYYGDGLPRTVPVTAVHDGDTWVKAYVHVPAEPGLREAIVSDKNAYMHSVGHDTLLFHRLHLDPGGFRLVVSRTRLVEASDGLVELEYTGTTWVMPEAVFEEKIGWATPALGIGGNRLVALIHGVDREMGVYRLFAAAIAVDKTGIVVEAVTPEYIMEPREVYEVYGDRPYTIFPCGVWRIDKNTILLSYGAGDYSIGLGLIDTDLLLSQLDRGRIY